MEYSDGKQISSKGKRNAGAKSQKMKNRRAVVQKMMTDDDKFNFDDKKLQRS